MKLVLLDRDGVINVDRPDSVKSRDEFVLFPQAISALKLLNEASIPIAVVTNQAVVGRGKLTREGLEDIHIYFQELLRREGGFIDKIYTCTSADDLHPDRKPNPGLLSHALHDFNVQSHDTVFIGDALRDLEAAKAVGCCRILVRTGKGQQTLQKGLPEKVLPVSIFDTLYEAASHIVKGEIC